MIREGASFIARGIARRGLALPLGVLGLAAGWLTADYLRAGAFLEDGSLRPTLVGLGIAAGVCVGRTVRAWALQPMAWVMARVAVLVCVVGITAGLLSGAIVYVSRCGGQPLLAGAIPTSTWAIEGLLTALTVLPAFAAVCAATWRIGRSRSGSLVGAAEARAPWLMLTASIAAGALAALPNWQDARGEELPWSVQASFALCAGALAHACALFALDLRALRRARAVLADAPRMRPRPDARSWSPDGAPTAFVDLGLGAMDFEIAKPAPTAYRGTDDVRLVVHGHPAASHAALASIVRQGGLAVGFATLCLLCAMQLPDAHLLARIGLAAPVHAAHATGVPECDLYLMELERCGGDTCRLRDSFRERAASSAHSGTLAESCRSALALLRPGCR